jgi:hypothetical protein
MLSVTCKPLVLNGFMLNAVMLSVVALKKLYAFFTKQAPLMRRSSVLSLPHQLVFPALSFNVRELCDYTLVKYAFLLQHCNLLPQRDCLSTLTACIFQSIVRLNANLI